MSDQLSFLPEIDRKATQKRVEEVLETARIYKQIGFVRREMKSTPSYSPRFHGQTNEIGAPVEDSAVWNTDQEERIRVLTERVEWAVTKLAKKEREIIKMRYLEEEDGFDYLISQDLNMSERTYRRIKARAFYKLAFMLKLEVVVQESA